MFFAHTRSVGLFVGVVFSFLIFASASDLRGRSGQRTLRRRESNSAQAYKVTHDVKDITEFFAKLPKDEAVTVTFEDGTYNQQIKIDRKSPTHITASARGMVTIRNAKIHPEGGDGSNQDTATLYVSGCKDFQMTNMVVENPGITKDGVDHPGLAISIDNNAVARITDSKILGRQDTMHVGDGATVHAQNSTVEGTVDFIYGTGTVRFHKCKLNSIRNKGTVFAMKGSKGGQAIASNCQFTASGGVLGCFIARPWDSSSQVICLNSEMGLHLHGDGFEIWNDKDGDSQLANVLFAEYNSYGPGSTGRTKSFKQGTDTDPEKTKRTTKTFVFALSKGQAARYTEN